MGLDVSIRDHVIGKTGQGGGDCGHRIDHSVHVVPAPRTDHHRTAQFMINDWNDTRTVTRTEQEADLVAESTEPF